MSLNMNDPRFWEIQARHIFVIIFETENLYFINDTVVDNDRRYYWEHWHERNRITREHIRLCKERNEVPPMYYLDTVVGTKADSFARKLDWAVYLEESGYECMVEALYPFIDNYEATDYYKQISRYPFELVFTEDHEIYHEYLEDMRLSQKESAT